MNPAIRKPVHPINNRFNCGFTLIELLVVLAIVAILAALAAPSFARLIATSTVTGQVNDFIADSRFARSEALRRGTSVTMCRSANTDADSPTCSADTSAGWESGWIVFVDADSNNSRIASEQLLRVHARMADSGGIRKAGKTSYNQLRYRSTGWAIAATATLRFLPLGASAQADMGQGRTVCISFLGRVRSLPTADAGCSGAE